MRWASFDAGQTTLTNRIGTCPPGGGSLHLQRVFAVDWAFASKEVLRGDLWFPSLSRSCGAVGARGVPDGPDEDFEHMSEVILGALATASESVRRLPKASKLPLSMLVID